MKNYDMFMGSHEGGASTISATSPFVGHRILLCQGLYLADGSRLSTTTIILKDDDKKSSTRSRVTLFGPAMTPFLPLFQQYATDYT